MKQLLAKQIANLRVNILIPFAHVVGSACVPKPLDPRVFCIRAGPERPIDAIGEDFFETSATILDLRVYVIVTGGGDQLIASEEGALRTSSPVHLLRADGTRTPRLDRRSAVRQR